MNFCGENWFSLDLCWNVALGTVQHCVTACSSSAAKSCLLFKTLMMWNGVIKKCIAFLLLQHFGVHWQAQEGFSMLSRSQKLFKGKVQAQAVWTRARIPHPAPKPHGVSGCVLVCQTWNLAAELGFRRGDNDGVLCSSKASDDNLPACNGTDCGSVHRLPLKQTPRNWNSPLNLYFLVFKTTACIIGRPKFSKSNYFGLCINIYYQAGAVRSCVIIQHTSVWWKALIRFLYQKSLFSSPAPVSSYFRG